jgi:hypothetical protein
VLAGAGLSGSGLAAGLAAWKPVLISLSLVSLLLSHWLVWRRGWGGWPTRILLIVATIVSPTLWFVRIHTR